MAMTKRLRTKSQPQHRKSPSCECAPCRNDRMRGCSKPYACCALAEKMLQSLPELWNPVNNTPHDGLSLSQEERRINEAKRDQNEPFLFDPSMTSADDLTAGFRIFYDLDTPAKFPPKRLPRLGAIVREETTHAYIGSATSNEGSRDAKAGAAVILRRDVVTSGRVPKILPQSGLAAEATGIIMASLGTPMDAPLHIHTTSTQITDALNQKLRGWEDRDWTGVRDKMILRSAAYHLRKRSAPTTWHLHKVTEGDRDKSGEARIEADLCLHEEVEMDIDLSVPPQYNNSGVKLSELTQRLAYQRIRAMKSLPPRQRAADNLHLILWAIDGINGMRPTDQQIWESVRTKPITRQIADFLWRAIHGSIKCGRFWAHVPGLEDRGICHKCGLTESVKHMLLECSAHGQETAWDMAKETWARTGKQWPSISIGAILGVGLLAPPHMDEGEQRLLKIIITETTWL